MKFHKALVRWHLELHHTNQIANKCAYLLAYRAYSTSFDLVVTNFFSLYKTFSYIVIVTPLV